MHILYLAAGFGTRLLEYGQTMPKGLIPFGNTTLLDRLVQDTQRLGASATLCTNERFFSLYTEWRDTVSAYKTIDVVSDGAKEPAQHLGALGDIAYIFEQKKLWGEDVLVLSTDTYYQFAMSDFVAFAQEKRAFATVVRDMGTTEPIRGRLGCATMTGEMITAFVEKPQEPSSTFAAIPFYWYAKEMHEDFARYKQEREDMDAPGRIIPWLLSQGRNVFGYVTKDQTLDVGTITDVEQLQHMKQ